MPANAAPDPALAAALRRLREDAGISQEELAGRAGLHYTSLREIELAKADPMWGTVKRLSEALGVEPVELIRLAERIGDEK